jgi:hypothetical protein
MDDQLEEQIRYIDKKGRGKQKVPNMMIRIKQ